MKKAIKRALISTLPVMTGYLVLGFGFGIIMRSEGFGILVSFAMSFFIYAGSMQYVAVGLMTGGASLITVALTTLMVNARHLFYGVSMLDRYKGMGAVKPYLIFGLTDETYSLVCGELPTEAEGHKRAYFFFVTLFDHIYWVTGTLLGAIAGTVLKFNTEGIDFALTALFVTVFVDQWLGTKKHIPAVVGVFASVACLIIFGKDSFLIPAMLVIALILSLYRGEAKGDE